MDRMCDCWLGANQMLQLQLGHWLHWCIVMNSRRWLIHPMTIHFQNDRLGYRWLHPNIRQHVNLVCMLMVELVLNCFEHLHRPMCSTHLCSHLFRWMIQFWHNLCCKIHRRVLCKRLWCLHRMVNLVSIGIDVNDDLRMVSCQVTMGNLCMRLLHFGHDVQPIPCPCRMFDADVHKIRSVQNMNSYWQEFCRPFTSSKSKMKSDSFCFYNSSIKKFTSILRTLVCCYCNFMCLLCKPFKSTEFNFYFSFQLWFVYFFSFVHSANVVNAGR